jgi:hypothetical protein
MAELAGIVGRAVRRGGSVDDRSLRASADQYQLQNLKLTDAYLVLLRTLRRAVQDHESLSGEEWDTYVDRLVMGDDPVWVSVDVVKTAYGLATADEAQRKAYQLADDGVLTYDPLTNTVTFACPYQALIVSDDPPSVATVGSTLSTYDRVCLRYPYGPLGIAVEAVVARSLVSTRWEGASSVVPIGGAPRGLTALALPKKGSAGSLKTVCDHVMQHKPGHAVSTLVSAAGGWHWLTIDGRLELLRKHSGVVFKESPDLYGGDLVWFTVDDASHTVTIRRVQVKLGTSRLDAAAVCTALAEGWPHIQNYVLVPSPYKVDIRHFLLTTRDVGDIGTYVDGVCVVHGAEMRRLWSEEIQEFGRRRCLEAYYVPKMP